MHAVRATPGSTRLGARCATHFLSHERPVVPCGIGPSQQCRPECGVPAQQARTSGRCARNCL